MIDIVEGLINGNLTSPQKVKNNLLVVMKVTGTGETVREDEKVYVRSESEFLSQKFLDSCQLATITLDHPHMIVNDENVTCNLHNYNYQKYSVGHVVKAFVAGKDVLCVASIRLDQLEPYLSELTTSPSINSTGREIDGKVLETFNSIDHLALLPIGTGHWDVENKPSILTGMTIKDYIENTSEVLINSDVNKKQEETSIMEEKLDLVDESAEEAKEHEGAGFREYDNKEGDDVKETASEASYDEGTGFRDEDEKRDEATEVVSNDKIDEIADDIVEDDFETLKAKYNALKDEHDVLLANQTEIMSKLDEMTGSDEEVINFEDEALTDELDIELRDVNRKYANCDFQVNLPKKRGKTYSDYMKRVISLNKSKVASEHKAVVDLIDNSLACNLEGMQAAIDSIRSAVMNHRVEKTDNRTGIYTTYENGRKVAANMIKSKFRK